jgi:hypothetical protein
VLLYVITCSARLAILSRQENEYFSRATSFFLKFCVKIGKSVTETFEMLKTAFGEEAMCRTQMYKWGKRFKEGRTSVDDAPRSGQPSTLKTDNNVSKVR